MQDSDEKEKSSFKYGKIHNFDGLNGEIVTEDTIYYFCIDNILDGEIVSNGDWVRFNGKTEDLFPQAYFITKIVITKTK